MFEIAFRNHFSHPLNSAPLHYVPKRRRKAPYANLVYIYIYLYILRLRPCRRPLLATGYWLAVWLDGCLGLQFGLGFDVFVEFSVIWRWFSVSWRSLGRLLGTLVDACSPLGVQGDPLEVPGRFVHEFRVSFGASGHQLLMKKLVWNMFFSHMFSEWFIGVFCVGLWSSRATLESEKPGKFMVGSSFFKV